MKKNILLTGIIFIVILTTSFAQTYPAFEQASNNTGMKTNCDEVSGTGYGWGFYGPKCAGGGEDAGGGFDAAASEKLGAGYGYGTVAAELHVVFTLSTALDLSGTGNQQLNITLSNKTTDPNNGYADKNDTTITYRVQLLNSSDEDLLNDDLTFTVGPTDAPVILDFSTHIASGKDLTDVKRISIQNDNCTNFKKFTARLYLSKVSVGSLLITAGNKEPTSVIADHQLFPNPSSEAVTLDLSLKSNSDVKVVISEQTGKEVKTIQATGVTTLNSHIDVSGFAKGIYVVGYYINGIPADKQLLMIK